MRGSIFVLSATAALSGICSVLGLIKSAQDSRWGMIVAGFGVLCAVMIFGGDQFA
jgi:hypothetical protein